MSIRRGRAWTDIPAPPAGGPHIGFNFREAVGPIDDVMDYWSKPQRDPYPTAFSGRLYDTNAGFWVPSGGNYQLPPSEGTQNDTSDARLAGWVGVPAASNQRAFKIDLPAGQYRVWVGSGLNTVNVGVHVECRDGLTDGNQSQLFITDLRSTGGNFQDALSQIVTRTDWINNYDVSFQLVTLTDRGAGNTGIDFRFLYANRGSYYAHVRVQGL